MPRYPARPLEEKLTWMRERQQQKAAREALVAQVEELSPGRVAELSPPPSGARTPPERKMFRVDQVATMLGVSRRTVLRWFSDRAVIIRPGRRTTMLISERVLDEFLAEHQARPPGRQ